MENERKSEQDSKLLVRQAEAAVMLSMSERNLWSLVQAGEVPSFKIGRSRFFSVDALKEWIASKIDYGGAA